MIYYGYERGSKLTSYVTTRGVQNLPYKFIWGGVNNRPQRLVKILGGFQTTYVGTYEGGL